ncbi:hypothetical protein FHR92_004349 [Fontibacillus solani]|uniref:Uncharacterized protein n=1 Tax=Fontibacillus solani TaxID=1572857 RepID=A0A7W3SX40_9BACL|nr:hypothetical protein [Fontibacillus solani]MBA9087856.1 hypothetical protein [Fontibacillus solani]
MKGKGTVVIIAVVMLALGIVGGTFIAKLTEDKDTIDSATTVINESSIPTETTESVDSPSNTYNSGDIVDIAKAKIAPLVVTVTDSFMDADGHSYEIFNQPEDTENNIVVHLNKQFSTLKYSVFNKAILTGSGSEGVSIICESTKDGDSIGNPILSTVVPSDEIYPLAITVDVTGLDYVVIVDQKHNLQTYNFNAIAK